MISTIYPEFEMFELSLKSTTASMKIFKSCHYVRKKERKKKEMSVARKANTSSSDNSSDFELSNIKCLHMH